MSWTGGSDRGANGRSVGFLGSRFGVSFDVDDYLWANNCFVSCGRVRRRRRGGRSVGALGLGLGEWCGSAEWDVLGEDARGEEIELGVGGFWQAIREVGKWLAWLATAEEEVEDEED